MKTKTIILFLLTLNSTTMFSQNMLTPNSSGLNAIALRLIPGDDLKTTLDNYIRKNHIKASCILTCAGSLSKAVIRYADKKEADTLNGKFEIVSLSGTLAESGSHLHISISDGNGKTIGGHLKEGSIIYTTAEIVIGILTDLEFTREVDSTYGFKELFINQASEK